MNSKDYKITKISNIVEKIGIILIVIFTSVMVISVVINVVARNIFASSFEKLEELARFMLVYITFIGTSLIYREKGHLGIEFFVQLFKNKKTRKIINAFTSAFNLVFFAILLIYGGKMAIATINQKSLQLRVSMGFIYLIIPISGMISILFFLEYLYSEYVIKQTEE